jgi:SNF2 family DNA or RNA helicase
MQQLAAAAQDKSATLGRWRHQEEAYKFAFPKRGAMLAMAMGTGKSKVAIDLAIGRGHKRILILCPLSVVSVWPREFHKHAGDLVAVTPLDKGSVSDKADAMKRALALAAAKQQPAAIAVNYEAAWREQFAEACGKAGFDFLILDESHRIKSPSGKASRFVFRLSRLVMHRLALTGTPMPHSFLDIYAQYRSLDPTVFGTNFNRFKHIYGVWGGYGGYELKGVQNKELLNQKIYSIAYRVAKNVLDLPPEMHITRSCELGAQAQKLYADLENKFIAEVRDGTVTVYNALTKLLRLQQITSGYVRLDDDTESQVDDSKYQLMKDTVEDIEPEEPIVVFCRFRHDLDQVHRMAEELRRTSLELSGRRNELRDWQDGAAEILAVQIQSGGVGIDLTRARYCGYFSKGYSLGDYEQSLARVHRPGQTRPVTYFHWVVSGTVDQRVMDALAKRRDVVEDILAQIKQQSLFTERRS